MSAIHDEIARLEAESERLKNLCGELEGLLTTAHICGDKLAARTKSDAATIASLKAEVAELKRLNDKLKLEAQIHAQEARTANTTIYEGYQAATGGTGEPGNWNGAKPFRDLAARLSASEAEVDELKAVLKWTDEVYPARIEAGGAGVEITWEEFNAMREAAGFRPVKRIGDPEGRAGFNHKLRMRAQASEALNEKLRAALEAVARDWVNPHDGAPFDDGEVPALDLARVALQSSADNGETEI